jgi:Ala-tRNA(Pro) deacylase
MPVAKLRDFLDAHHIKYTVITHSLAFTAQEVAASAHVRGRELAKTVIVAIDGRMAMVVEPASQWVHLGQLKAATGAASVALSDERDFKDRFPDCEPGAMPPFGNLYGMDVYVGEALTKDEEIAFNAGSHTELIKMQYRDFANLVHPIVLPL